MKACISIHREKHFSISPRIGNPQCSVDMDDDNDGIPDVDDLDDDGDGINDMEDPDWLGHDEM